MNVKSHIAFPAGLLNGFLVPGRDSARMIRASAVIVLASAVAVSLLGTKALLIPVIVLLLYLALRFESFLYYFYLTTLPLVSFNIPHLSVRYNYSLVFILAALWLIRKILIPGESIKYSKPILVFSFALLVVAAASAFNHGLLLREVKSLVKTVIFFSLIFIVYDTYKPGKTLPIFISFSIPVLASSLVMFSTFASAGSVLQLLDLYRLKPAGFFENSNTFAGVILCLLPYWAAMSIWHRKLAVRIASSVPALILLVALVFTNSRAAFVGLFVVIILFCYWAKVLKYALLVLLITIVLLAIFPEFLTIGSMALRVERGGSSRLDVWANTLDMIKHNFWLGIGMSNYRFEYARYFTTAAEMRFFKFVPHAHNQILQTTAQFGIMGFVLIMALHIFPIKKSIELLKTVPHNIRYLAYAVVAGIIGTMARSLFEADGMLLVGEIYPYIVFWTLLIMLLKFSEIRDEAAGAARISYS